jgi:hypothetical protein
MTESELSEMRISHFIGTPDGSTLLGRTLSFDINLKKREGSQRMQITLDDWESYFEEIADEGYSMITKAPFTQDFEEVKTKEAAGRDYLNLSIDKTELQNAVEKFKTRIAGLSSNKEQSPDMENFDTLHFEVLIPYMKEVLKHRVGPGISIGVAEKDGNRVIHITTLKEVEYLVRLEIREAVVDFLGPVFRDKTTLKFSKGRLIRSVDKTGEVQGKPRNPYQYHNLEMGDSIGSHEGDGVSTAGPKIMLGDLMYRVNCWHMWERHYASKPEEEFPNVHHPSHQVDAICQHTGPSRVRGSREIGQVVLASGHDRTTTRVSDHPYFIARNESWKSVADWTVSREKDSPNAANIVRMTGMPRVKEDIAITSTSRIRPGAHVYSSGRSSGLQIGHVRERPTFMDGAFNGTGQDTFEWTVEQALTDIGQGDWKHGGLGVQGDSGAAVFDLETSSLCGQVWATMTDETGNRVAYISDWLDIAGHIEETHRRHLSPKLPIRASQQTPSEPICVECAAERVEYLECLAPVMDMIRDCRPLPSPSVDSSATYSAAGSPVSEASAPDDQEMSDVEKKLTGSRSSLHRCSAPGQTILKTNAGTKAVVNASKKKVTKQIVTKFVEQLPTILDEGFFIEPDSMMPQAPPPPATEQVRIAAIA